MESSWFVQKDNDSAITADEKKKKETNENDNIWNAYWLLKKI